MSYKEKPEEGGLKRQRINAGQQNKESASSVSMSHMEENATKCGQEQQIEADYLMAKQMNEETNEDHGANADFPRTEQDLKMYQHDANLRESDQNKLWDEIIGNSSEINSSYNNNKRHCKKLERFLTNIQLEFLVPFFDEQMIDLRVLSTMTDKQMKANGLEEFGLRSRILAEFERLRNLAKIDDNDDAPVLLVNLDRKSEKMLQVVAFMNSAVREHRGNPGGEFKKYEIVKVENIRNSVNFKTYERKQNKIAKANDGNPNERLLFHGSVNAKTIALEGFDISNASDKGMFGQGHYFTDVSSKANQYSFGAVGDGCQPHSLSGCYDCERQLLVCRVTLGRCTILTAPVRYAHAPPGYNSVYAKACDGFLDHDEYVVYNDEQVIPIYLVSYKIMDPAADAILSG